MSGNQMLLLGGAQAPAVDPYFYSVTSLLHGDGTNGGQNNTFLDSSTNNFTITRNGNTTQGSFSPFSQTGWSNYFDGTGDSIKISSGITNQFAPGSAFTCEGWFYLNNSSASQMLFCVGGSTVDWNATTGILFQIYLFSGTLYWQSNAGGSANSLSGTCPSLNAWHHIAVGYNGTTTRVWIDGTSFASGTPSYSVPSYSNAMVGGDVNNGNTFYGYASNVRFVKGTDVYGAGNTSITVPTTPLTAITNTQLLTCQANRFLDASSNNFTITRNGDVSVQPFSPFNPTTAYSTSAVGGSGYFDGSGDYLTVADNAALELGNSNFCVELFYFPTSVAGSRVLIGKRTTPATDYGFVIFASGATLQIYISSGNSSYDISNGVSIGTLSANQWHHIAVYRVGNAWYGSFNGVITTLNASNSSSVWDNSAPWAIGAESNATSPIVGYMSDVRFVIGSSVYTASSAPVPTAPLTAISNTRLLLNFTNGAIFDNAAVADYETVGNAQISTSVKKYGTGSLAFDGTGDYLLSPGTQNLTFGTGDFTIEFWLYLNVLNADQVIYDTRPASTQGAYPVLYFSNGNSSLNFFTDGTNRITSSVTSGIWYHVAVCRAASQTKMFINGTQVGSTYADTTNYLCNRLVVGASSFSLGSGSLNGYIDDLRISKGIARYTYNFTPPTAELPNIGGTVTLTADPYFDYTTLLLPGNGTNGAQNNTFLDSSTNAFSITRNGNTTQGTFSPFSQTGWGNYFDGSGDWLSVASNAAFGFGAGDFTVETFVYINAYPAAYYGLIDTRVSSAVGIGTYIDSIGKLVYANNFTILANAGTIAPRQWVHLAVSRSSGTVKGFVNGTEVFSVTDSRTLASSAGIFVGDDAISGNIYGINGYMSNVRVVKGTAVYTSNFTPSTTPLTAISGTSLLTCQSNRFIDNSTNAFAITRNGDVSVQAFSPFNPTASWSAATNGGSGYFDGSGDYLSIPYNAALDFGNANFTVEGWVYSTNNGAALLNVIDFGWSSGLYAPLFVANTNGTLLFYASSNNSSWDVANATTIGVLPLNSWNHFAISRNGSSIRVFFNGALVTTITSSATLISNATRAITIGADTAGANAFSGYIAGIRVVKGSSVYDAAFTVPTAPPTAVTNTQLLTNFTNAGIYDATSKNDLETVGNAQISTTQSKFGGSSMAFDGSGDWLSSPDGQNYNLGSGDCTIECWVYVNNLTNPYGIFGKRTDTGTQFRWILAFVNSSTGTINCQVSTTGSSWAINANTTSAITAGTWNHIAFVRYGSDFSVYVNGIKNTLSTSLSGSIFNGTEALIVGATGTSGSFIYSMNGYIDDLRITKGIARYTSNFTPPTTAFLTL